MSGISEVVFAVCVAYSSTVNLMVVKPNPIAMDGEPTRLANHCCYISNEFSAAGVPCDLLLLHIGPLLLLFCSWWCCALDTAYWEVYR